MVALQTLAALISLPLWPRAGIQQLYAAMELLTPVNIAMTAMSQVAMVVQVNARLRTIVPVYSSRGSTSPNVAIVNAKSARAAMTVISLTVTGAGTIAQSSRATIVRSPVNLA